MLGDLEPASLSGGPLGLLPAFVGVLSKLICPGNRYVRSFLAEASPRLSSSRTAAALLGIRVRYRKSSIAAFSSGDRRNCRRSGRSRLADFVGRFPATRLIGLTPNKALVGLALPIGTIRDATNGGKMRSPWAEAAAIVLSPWIDVASRPEHYRPHHIGHTRRPGAQAPFPAEECPPPCPFSRRIFCRRGPRPITQQPWARSRLATLIRSRPPGFKTRHKFQPPAQQPKALGRIKDGMHYETR
jgi:hypothetical protein